MGKTVKSALLVFLFVIAIGLPIAYSAMDIQCSSQYDCRLTGCPCSNGRCTCSEINSKAPPKPPSYEINSNYPPKPPSKINSKAPPKAPSAEQEPQSPRLP
ncbi:hypothetical protein SOVF_029170 [Spinacia oleracea]|uniref:Uncharacterized protein n=1 Tax=Spinacia oleracea TaxID=3562 RepID=A0A9R0JRT5_SPIOL|nr:uncharacterized protein LOC110784467 [Spinacia oleracea]KNA22952.1 hypothetical protein SOVF_029170 [Spinacia oleracea]